MRKWSVRKVPAGKRPKLRKPFNFYSIGTLIKSKVGSRKLSRIAFIPIAVCFIVTSISLHDYLSNYVYIVKIDEREVGVVNSAKEVEVFIAHITDRFGKLYGMAVEPDANVVLIKEFRPGAKPAPEVVKEKIRQQLTFTTDAYVITVDGEPFVAVRSEDDLDQVVSKLKNIYTTNQGGIKTITAQINQDLAIEPGTADPELILEPDEVVTLLAGIDPLSDQQLAFLPSSLNHSVQTNSYATDNNDQLFSVNYMPHIAEGKAALPVISEQDISVTTVEEVTVKEAIPFDTEYKYSDDLWVVQRDITVEGVEGLKEAVYHITRENGVEVDRMKIRETIIYDPVTQVETVGTAKVPDVGTGRFIWPVEGGGEITPGRGFSSWHTGIDIHADTGTNILAADSGVVWFSGYGRTQGNYLILYHGSFWTLYLHNNQNLVQKGDAVQQGDVIAKAGSTGRSTGPHLHFEVRLDDGTGEWLSYYQHTPIDPLQFFTP